MPFTSFEVGLFITAENSKHATWPRGFWGFLSPPPIFHQRGTGITGVCCSVWPLFAFKIGTLNLMLIWQMFYPLSWSTSWDILNNSKQSKWNNDVNVLLVQKSFRRYWIRVAWRPINDLNYISAFHRYPPMSSNDLKWTFSFEKLYKEYEWCYVVCNIVANIQRILFHICP